MSLRLVDGTVLLGAHRALDGVSCAFDRGWIAIVGPNGAGKSTLLRAVAGLQPLASGVVTLDDRPLAAWSARERGRRVAWLAQPGDATGDLDVGETVALGRVPHLGLTGAPRPADDAAVERALVDTGSAAWRHRALATLSGGERQRVLLARALATDAATLLLDEPTTHLDPPHQVALVHLARRLAASRTVVSVLHDLPLALHADRVLVLERGRVRAEGAYDDPRLHAALVDVFDGAIRIETVRGRPLVVPDLDDPAR